MTCSPNCLRPTPTQCHCGACHLTFGSPRPFDRHRRLGECLEPGSVGLLQRDGIWRMPGEPVAHWRQGQPSDG